MAAPTASTSDLNETKRVINDTQQRRLFGAGFNPKTGGLIEFESSVTNSKSKTCS